MTEEALPLQQEEAMGQLENTGLIQDGINDFNQSTDIWLFPKFGAINKISSENPEIFKTVINDVSLNAALIANGNRRQSLDVDKSKLDAGLTNLNHYERLDQNQEITRQLREKRRFSTGTDLTDIIGSYQ
ncbi:hypothetical protein HII12_001401 [Brettanomyces bruxellensis]|uniref:Uncharacterized protein n=1 Tax=Dekkera bruxellensis TaxID=5007 RepID=A0A8H6EXQ0_DEKBR|nr:hypothetical protein HII12_001401 [Brettanomyces bruxellensis]